MESYESDISIDRIASSVAAVLARRLSAKEITKLLHIVFLEVEDVAELLRVSRKTVYCWISRGSIPVRYAGGKPIFLLAEILDWTLPDDDQHSRHRLPVAVGCSIAENRLATSRERKGLDDVGL